MLLPQLSCFFFNCARLKSRNWKFHYVGECLCFHILILLAHINSVFKAIFLPPFTTKNVYELSELSEISETKWQIEWDRTTKGVTTKLYFPKVADRLKSKINVTPNLTMMVTGHGNIKSYLYLLTYSMVQSPS